MQYRKLHSPLDQCYRASRWIRVGLPFERRRVLWKKKGSLLFLALWLGVIPAVAWKFSEEAERGRNPASLTFLHYIKSHYFLEKSITFLKQAADSVLRFPFR